MDNNFSKSSNEWSDVCLNDFIKVKHGYAFKGKYITTEETPHILVTPGNFYIGGGFKSSKFKYYTDVYPEEYILNKDDIVVTMTDLSKESDTLGYSAKVPQSVNGEKYLHNQRIGLVEFKNEDIEPDFAYWLMRTRDYQGFIVGSASGTSIMHTSPTRICEYEFKLPSLPEQKAIAEVLSSLDDKIDLLHRQNKTLEAMAETLFRQWFVEEADDDCKFEKLGKFVKTIDNRGKTPPNRQEKTNFPLIEVNALKDNTRLVDYSVIRKYVDEEIFKNWFRAHPKKYDTLFSTVGSIAEVSMFLLEIGSIAQNVVAFSPINGMSPFYLYEVLSFYQRDIKEFDIGSVQPSIKVSHLMDYEIPIPKDIDKIETFNQIMLSNCNKMEMNYKGIKNLEKLRDTLLPKLMSGEVRVDVERIIS